MGTLWGTPVIKPHIREWCPAKTPQGRATLPAFCGMKSHARGADVHLMTCTRAEITRPPGLEWPRRLLQPT